MKKISIVIPCHNEEGNVNLIFKEIQKIFNKKKFEYEIIFIDDGSVDHTYLQLTKILKSDVCEIKVIKFSRNFGKESAIYAGLEISTGDYVAIIDADMQQDPNLINDMLNILETQPEYDSVCCFQDKRDEGKILTFFKNCFYKIINKICTIDFVRGASDFRLLSRDMVNAIVNMQEKNRFSKGIFSWIGFKTYYLPYLVKKRATGKSSWSFKKLFKYATDGIIAFSSTPLKVILWIGVIIFVPASIMLIILLVQTIMGVTHHIKYLIDIMALFSGLILIALGVVGEYISKIYDETKNRPIYLSNNVLTNEGVINEKNRRNI